MNIPLKLALLVAVISCGCRADLQMLRSPNGPESDSVLAKLINLENRITECLTDVKSQVYELQYKAFSIEELQKSRNDLNPLLPTDQQMCPCGSEQQHGFMRSCKDLKNKPSGRYMVGAGNKVFEVYCEQQLDDGGWTVIQNRYDGSVDFNKGWSDYREGFGVLSGEFWLGLEKIHVLTSSRDHELMVRMTGFDDTTAFARYKRFAISGENNQYELTTLEYTSGTTGLDSHKNKKFSTFDRDNDPYSSVHCAQQAQSGWWHRCYDFNYSNLNGLRQNLYNSSYYSPLMTWYNFKSYNGIKTSKMMIREV